MTSNRIEPVKKVIELNCSIEHAFNIFTEKFGVWWPLKTHSCSQENASTVEMEHFVGGKVVETSKNGKTYEWGEVLKWNPPFDFSMTWYPDETKEVATRVTVQFEKLDAQKTKLNLLHEGWEARGDKAVDIRNTYNSGWTGVLASYESFIVKGKSK